MSLGAALIAALIYRKRARRCNDASYNESADEFENLAVQILDKFYQSSEHACTQAIIREIPAFGNVTWLQVAVAAEAKQFIAQRAVQDVLNNIWYVLKNDCGYETKSLLCPFDLGTAVLISVFGLRLLSSQQSICGIADFFVMKRNSCRPMTTVHSSK